MAPKGSVKPLNVPRYVAGEWDEEQRIIRIEQEVSWTDDLRRIANKFER